MDYTGIATKESFAKDFANACYYSVLSNSSTNNTKIEQELVYILYLLNAGVPVVNYLSIESVENGYAAGLKDYTNKAFQRFSTPKFSEQLFGLNVDGTNMDTGIHKGLGAKIKKQIGYN